MYRYEQLNILKIIKSFDHFISIPRYLCILYITCPTFFSGLPKQKRCLVLMHITLPIQ